ncbi:lipopolysaccharide heptosyltransferase I [Mycena latifolia]|nr:lipopolysaccharide heptosyltransferase I [Mycena latifolia]
MNSLHWPAPVFLAAVALSWLLTPSPHLYTPGISALYSPPPPPVTGPPITTSIIVPTYHERANLAPLVLATFAALPPALAAHTELLIVDDDSRDGTEEEIARLRADGYPPSRSSRGRAPQANAASARPSSGASSARHPSAAIPALLAALGPHSDSNGVETRIPPWRWGPGTGAASWMRAGRCTAADPMTGFFAVRKDAVRFVMYPPPSASCFKIALELLLAIPGASRPPEVPYSFGVRTAGASKLGAKVIIKCVLQLLRLYRRALDVFWHVLVGGGVAGMATVVRRGGVGRVVRLVGGDRARRRNGKGLLPIARRGGRLE